MTKITLNRHVINIQNEDKIFFPEGKITKGELVEYYKKNSANILRHCSDRALVMNRYPNGIYGEGFFQKNVSEYFPPWIERIKVKSRTVGGSNDFLVCNNAASLVYTANQACITFHMWLSKIDKMDYPDVIVFDLDTHSEDISQFRLICDVAIFLKEILEKHGLSSWVMTTGSKGLHVRVPIIRKYTFSKVREFAKKIAEMAVAIDPKQITLESRKEKRKGKILIDVVRNSFGATAVIPYSLRPKPYAPVATPIDWKELKDKKLTSQKYNIKNIFSYLSKKGDVWSKMKRSSRSLDKALKLLGK